MSTPEEKMVQKPAGSRTGMYAVIAVVVIVVLLVVVAWGLGWLTPKTTNSTTPGACTPPTVVPLVGGGSTFVSGLMTTWETSYTHGQINYQAVGSGSGISQLTAKAFDFGASDAPLSAAQRAALPTSAVTIPETGGGVAMIYNVPGVPTLNFTGAVIAGIYLGTITMWNDPAIAAANPASVTLPAQSIIVVHRSDGSGTTFAFTDFLSKSSTTWATNYGKSTADIFPIGTGESKSSGVGGFVQTTPYTIGYVDLSYALSNGLTFGRVQNPSGAYLLPTLTNTAAAIADGAASLPAGTADWYNVSVINEPGAGDYPITTFSYLMVYQSIDGAYGSSYGLGKAQNLVDFLNWTITYGQSYSAQLYYVPLPASVVTSDQSTIKTITYGGAAIPICTLQ